MKEKPFPALLIGGDTGLSRTLLNFGKEDPIDSMIGYDMPGKTKAFGICCVSLPESNGIN
jgi:hypothetical protein